MFCKMTANWVHALLVTLFSSLLLSSEAVIRDLEQQETGRNEICYCAPNSYDFTLDFTLMCPPVNITLGDAISATTCTVSPFEKSTVIDLVPVSVDWIEILEMNQNFVPISWQYKAGNFSDGDTFSYTSQASMTGIMINQENIVKAIQLNIYGINKDGEKIINFYLITFTNFCEAYPVLSDGQFAGWTRFSNLTPPNKEYCPAAPQFVTQTALDPPSARPTFAPRTAESISAMSMSLSTYFDGSLSSIKDPVSLQDYYNLPSSSSSTLSASSTAAFRGRLRGNNGYHRIGGRIGGRISGNLGDAVGVFKSRTRKVKLNHLQRHRLRNQKLNE